MITLNDCEAFCDANPNWVQELACSECLTMVQAYALAHEAMSYTEVATPMHPQPVSVSYSSVASQQRLAA